MVFTRKESLDAMYPCKQSTPQHVLSNDDTLDRKYKMSKHFELLQLDASFKVAVLNLISFHMINNVSFSAHEKTKEVEQECNKTLS